ncbi:HIT family protein [Orrella sp. JC864]|uniref:HIT family protein n=1 Tax=Orrella sp. JC864 TaxID=3120298 RepID=UPI0012BD4775
MSTDPAAAGCPLCRGDGGQVLWRDAQLRVVDAGEPDYPGFTRVIWQDHAAEMSDLDEAARQRLMRAVLAVEQAQRRTLAPDKINLASLGNMVPHVHWHVIPRWRDDRHFPDAVWAAPRRDPGPSPQAPDAAALARYRQALAQALQEP